MFVVKAQQPANAHLTMPEDTPVLVVSKHVVTPRGLKNALRRMRRQRSIYRSSHGNATAQRAWIEYKGMMLDPVVLDCMTADEDWDDFWAEYCRTLKILDTIS